MVCHDRSLIGPPLFDDRRVVEIEHDIMRRVREWMAGGRLPPGNIARSGPSVTRRGHFDGYQGMASSSIVDPEAIVRPSFPVPRLEKGDRQPNSLLTQRPFSWMNHMVRASKERW